MTVLGLVAALVALLTGATMLKDTYLTSAERSHLRGIIGRAFAAARAGGTRAIDRAELRIAIRFVLRAGVLILIVASSGVAALECILGREPGTYDALLRCGLAAFMAMQAPCPWIRWITRGDRRHRRSTSEAPNVH